MVQAVAGSSPVAHPSGDVRSVALLRPSVARVQSTSAPLRPYRLGPQSEGATRSLTQQLGHCAPGRSLPGPFAEGGCFASSAASDLVTGKAPVRLRKTRTVGECAGEHGGGGMVVDASTRRSRRRTEAHECMSSGSLHRRGLPKRALIVGRGSTRHWKRSVPRRGDGRRTHRRGPGPWREALLWPCRTVGRGRGVDIYAAGPALTFRSGKIATGSRPCPPGRKPSKPVGRRRGDVAGERGDVERGWNSLLCERSARQPASHTARRGGAEPCGENENR